VGRKQTIAAAGLVLALAALQGCGEDPVAPGTDNGGGGSEGSQDLGPFVPTEIFLRPLSVQLPPTGGPLPTPSLVEHALTTFYRGGKELAQFDWTVPATIGTVEPKTPNLGRRDATVQLKIVAGGQPPLGFFDVSSQGTSGTESASISRRFAVIMNVWMKHKREYFQGDEPPDLVQWPVVRPDGILGTGTDIIFVSAPAGNLTRVVAIPANTPLNAAEGPVEQVFQLPIPPVPDNSNYSEAPKTEPDLAPPGLGRPEMLFSSQMDPQYHLRCPGERCSEPVPRRLWVVRLPDNVIITYQPRPLTADTTYFHQGRDRWIAFDYEMPRWNPTAVGAKAQIAYISDEVADPGGPRPRNLWVANLVDQDGDGSSDELQDERALTTVGGIVGFGWHPDGTKLCTTNGSRLFWVDAASGNQTPILLPDSSLTRLASPSVFSRPGEHDLVAFQAQSENLANIYVFDVTDAKLTKLLPFAMPVTQNLFPRWDPTSKTILYVSDYTVQAWANSTAGVNGVADRINPLLATFQSTPRTLYPSVWTVRLE
jgi:hypothetical protein